MQRKRFIFCYTDFTIPPVLRQNYSDPKKWSGLRKNIWHILKVQFGAFFGVEATHPIGEDNPDTFHPHLNFLWVMRDGFRPFIDVDELRAIFASALKYDGPVDFYHAYGDDDAQLMHWSKYITRIFPEFSSWAGSLRWYGHYPKVEKVRACVCPKCETAYRILGYINNRIIKAYDEFGFRLGRSPPWENDKNITPFKSKTYA
jgi:hypothetical protein